MPKILKRLKRDLKRIDKGEEPEESHIVFKQNIDCKDDKHTNYYLLESNRKG